MIFGLPGDIDLDHYQLDNTESFFGLPNKIQFCNRCVTSNQRPSSAVEYQHNTESKKSTININDDGVCDACSAADRKQNSINWREREDQLWDLCNKFRSSDGSYDCLVPGSGGKDSFYQSHILRTKFGMHPLTVTWAPHMYTDWGWSNFQSWLNAGFDNYLMTPNPRTHRLLTRLAMENLLHPFQPFIVGQKAFAPKIASKLGIPLIFYGENEAEYGNPLAENEVATRDDRFYSSESHDDLFLSGEPVSSLIQNFGLNLGDLEPYMPAARTELENAGVEVHYLGYYLKWHPQGAYYYATEHGGFSAAPERTPGTYSRYNSIDDKVDDFHYFTTFIKFGIGRATYDASQEIRNNEIDREEGVALVRKFDGEYPSRFESDFFRYISIPQSEFPVASKQFAAPVINRDYFHKLVNRFRSPHIWNWNREEDSWQLRGAVWK